jgi:hypothetical protein
VFVFVSVFVFVFVCLCVCVLSALCIHVLFVHQPQALLEVAQLQSSLLDDLHMENDGEDRGQALQPVSTTLEGAWGQSGGASRGYLLVKAQEEGLAGVEMHEICIGTPSKGHLGCGRGQERGAGKGELRTEERLLSVGRASVRELDMRCPKSGPYALNSRRDCLRCDAILHLVLRVPESWDRCCKVLM